MALVRVPVDPSVSGTTVGSVAGALVLEGLFAGTDLRGGAAVGIAEVEGVRGIYEVAATWNADNFCGFSTRDFKAGDPVQVISVRGSSVTPIIKGDVSFAVGDRVFISDVLGEVLNEPPKIPNKTLIQVGVASGEKTILLLTDFRVVLP